MTLPPQEHLGPGDRIMVVVAHPDDAEFMCSGSVAKWTREGREAVYVIATNGNKGTSDRDADPAALAALREAEQRAACAILGVETVEFLRYEDGTLQNTLELRREVARLIRVHRPSAVVTEDPTARFVGNRVNHPDHRAIGDAAVDAVFPSARDFHMWPEMHHEEGLEPHVVDHLYVSGRGGEANVRVDISETIEAKIAALRAHASQVRNPTPEFDEFVRGMARRNAEGSPYEYAESFRYFYLGARPPSQNAPPPNTPIRA
ncbi:MAG: PIG-L family deacetylase [Chloroflexota bacterium]|nr:PIG-L family deacetylase [Chloroflexota bacterium]